MSARSAPNTSLKSLAVVEGRAQTPQSIGRDMTKSAGLRAPKPAKVLGLKQKWKMNDLQACRPLLTGITNFLAGS